MTFLIILTTILLILDCLLLGLLVIIQLPKKEAGIGMAFGGGAADALFGAGSGTALSNLTKYSATAFFVLVFVLSIMDSHARHGNASELRRQMEKQSAMPAPPMQSTPATSSSANGASGVIPLSISSNAVTTPAPTAPAATATNKAATNK